MGRYSSISGGARVNTRWGRAVLKPLAWGFWAGLLTIGCGKTEPAPSTPSASPSQLPAAPSAAPSVAAAPAGPTLTGPASEIPEGAKACGALRCLEYPSASAAFREVLKSDPRVVGVGEAHALKGTEGVKSGVARFTDELLPELKGKASDLLLELWFPDPKCRKETVAQVKKQQEVVTKKQATANKNEYVELGNAAKKLGITPRTLHPSCEDLEAITKAGASDIGLMLETVAKHTERDIAALLKRQGDQAKLILAYGGAMHNDPHPREGAETWSFGVQVKKHTKYVALDLIVPEYIKDSAAWKSMPWYDTYAARGPGQHGALLYEPRLGEFVLIFPKATAKPE